MSLHPVDHIDDPRLSEYRDVPDPQLLRERGVFVAEGRLVVRTLLETASGRVRSVLATEAALAALADVVDPEAAPFPVYVGSKRLLSTVVGVNVHRGCLAIAERPSPVTVSDVLPPPGRPALVVVVERVVNADNIGGIFRNAAAFGVDAVVLSPGCCDPLYRKAIRTSIGATLRVPYAHAVAWPDAINMLRAAGISIVALTPGPGAVDIDQVAVASAAGRRLALLAGTEGEGLSEGARREADVEMQIPMVAGANSLNVATAVAIALHRFTDRVVRGVARGEHGCSSLSRVDSPRRA